MTTDIFGKVGQLTGTEFKNLRVSIGQTYATKVSLGNVVNTIDFSPYATKVSLNGYNSGSNIFDLLKATRAELGELKVTGDTTIVNTQTVEVSDNIIELNLASNGGETAQTSGIQINRGGQTTTNTNNYNSSTNWSQSSQLSGGYSNDEDIRTIEANGDSSALWSAYYVYDTGSNTTTKLIFKANNDIQLLVEDGSTFSVLTSQIIGTWSSTGFVMSDGWSFSNITISNGLSYLTQNGSNTSGNVVTDFDLTYTASNTNIDKAKILWNDTTTKFELKVGTALTDLNVQKIYFSNNFAQESDLPSASTFHGMFAHVHGTGKAYYSHAGAWHELITETGGQTINGNLTLTGDLAVSAGTNIKVNNVELGDFASFSNAFSNALT
tara:strand:+ start:2435 stop:3577 length:1143 start_codon:yes stop_codon:yes gene_type:complete